MNSQQNVKPSDVGTLPRKRSTLWAVSVPTEHGGWSLTLEPVVLGLIVAWSWSGLALGVAAMLAFLSRSPLKIVLGDIWRKRWLDRTNIAARVAGIEVAAFVLLVFYARIFAEASFWLPLLLAAPLVSIQLWFDIRSKSRRLLPELAGTIGIGSVATAIALANATNNKVAFGMWVVVAARGMAAIPYARTQVFRKRGRPVKILHSDLAQLLAVAISVFGFIEDVAPMASVIAIILIAVFNVVVVRIAPRPAKIIGLQQMFFGIAVIVITAVAMMSYN